MMRGGDLYGDGLRRSGDQLWQVQATRRAYTELVLALDRCCARGRSNAAVIEHGRALSLFPSERVRIEETLGLVHYEAVLLGSKFARGTCVRSRIELGCPCHETGLAVYLAPVDRRLRPVEAAGVLYQIGFRPWEPHTPDSYLREIERRLERLHSRLGGGTLP